jgi:thiosulfate/3-mercaptopyruvate sulfurtransferase
MIAFLTLCLLLPAEEYPVKNLLVEPADLAALQKEGKTVVLDARPLDAYKKGHVPGALHVDPASWGKAFQDGKDEKDWNHRIAILGIFPDSRIVIYDDASNKDAARIWWIMKFWGLEDVRLLHGMWTGYVAAQLPTSDVTAMTKASTIELKQTRQRLATKQDVLQALSAKSAAIVDARTEAEHNGKNKLSNKHGGCMPGAKNLDWEQLIDPKTKRFKSADELKKLFADAKIDVNAPQIAHCQGGGRSSVMAFAMELMGAKDVRNYHASWGEWGNSDDVPIEKK